MSDSNSDQRTETSSNLNYLDKRIGVEGSGNDFVGDGGASSKNYGISGATAPISGGSSYEDTGDVFSPVFQFSGSPASSADSWLTLGNTTKALQDNPHIRSDLAGMLAANGDGRTPEQWLYDDLSEGDTNGTFVSIVKKAAGVPPSNGGESSAQNFGGAAQTGGVVSGGGVSAPIASGEDSIAVQTNGGVSNLGDISGPVFTGDVGGPVVAAGGDIDAPVVNVTSPTTAPVTVIGGDNTAPIVNANAGPGGATAPISSGGDQEVNAPVIVGNNAPVTIQTSDPAVATAAISGVGESLTKSLSFADKALSAVAESKKDPTERESSQALYVVGAVALGFVALQLFSGRRAA